MLELSLREALDLGHTYIGTEHILLGLIREGDGVAAQVLVRLGADLNQVRTVVIQLLTGGTGAGSAPLGGGPDVLADRLASIAARLATIEQRLREPGPAADPAA